MLQCIAAGILATSIQIWRKVAITSYLHANQNRSYKLLTRFISKIHEYNLFT